MSKISRREFSIITAGAIVISTIATDEAFAATTFDAGDVKTFDKDGIYDIFAKANKLLIVREDNKLFAMSAMCTHRGCIVKKKDDGLLCPCHGSSFAKDGKPTKEPAKAALFRYAVSINADNHLIVDRSRLFGEREWGNADASVEVKG